METTCGKREGGSHSLAAAPLVLINIQANETRRAQRIFLINELVCCIVFRFDMNI